MAGNSINSRIYLSRKMSKLFIQLYKEHECLYDPSHDNYHNRIEKLRCQKCILQEIQKFVPELQLDNVRSKIKTLRTQFAHELTLIEAMEMAGIPYTPRLWCFKHLTFLRKYMSRLPNKEKGGSDDDSDSNDGSKSFYRELAEDKLNRRPIIPRRISFKWTRETTELYIKLHKKKKCLYDINHEDFGDREKRFEARQQLLDEMKVSVPWITMQDIWLKHKYLRDQYTKQLKVLAKAKANNIPYVPKLWCFHQLSYLRPYNGNDATPEKDQDSDDSNRKIEMSLDNDSSIPTDEDSSMGDVFEDKADSFIEDVTHHDNASENEEDADIEDAVAHDGASEDEDSSHRDDTMHNDTDSNPDETDSNHDEASNHCGNDYAEKNEVVSDHNNDIAEDEVEYDESVFKSDNCSYVEILPFEYDPNKNEMQDLKETRSSDEHVKTERIDNKSAIESQSIQISQQNRGTRRSNYQWLGNLVNSQLDEISPSYKSEFAWDIQCLVRKYILKSKVKCKTPGNSRTSGHSAAATNENLILPRSASLNISFL